MCMCHCPHCMKIHSVRKFPNARVQKFYAYRKFLRLQKIAHTWPIISTCSFFVVRLVGKFHSVWHTPSSDSGPLWETQFILFVHPKRWLQTAPVHLSSDQSSIHQKVEQKPNLIKLANPYSLHLKKKTCNFLFFISLSWVFFSFFLFSFCNFVTFLCVFKEKKKKKDYSWLVGLLTCWKRAGIAGIWSCAVGISIGSRWAGRCCLPRCGLTSRWGLCLDSAHMSAVRVKLPVQYELLLDELRARRIDQLSAETLLLEKLEHVKTRRVPDSKHYHGNHAA